MTALITGIIIFYSIHAIPHFAPIKGRLQSSFGEKGYLAAFALISAIGLGLMIYGKTTADYVHVWIGLMQLRHLTFLLVLVFFILLMAMIIPCNIRRWVHHPMLFAFLSWSVGHLLVNGDLASILFFGGFAVYSTFAIISAFNRGKRCALEKQPVWKDGLVIAVGAVLYVGVAKMHGVLFGVPLM